MAGKGTVGALVNDKQLYTNLEQTTSAMHDTMVQAQAGATDFQENMEALKHSFFVRGYFKTAAMRIRPNWPRTKLNDCRKAHRPRSLSYLGEDAFRQAGFGQAEEPEISQRGGEFLAE